MKTAVVLVDLQGDFTEFKNGSLAVPGTGQDFITTVLDATKRFKGHGLPIFATQDWHPQKHISFYTNHKGKEAFDVIRLRGTQQVLWPPHCVQETEGAKLLIDEELIDVIVKKGMEIEYDSYSGFKDDGETHTPLHHLLQKWGIGEIVVYGIATDYCVKATALDAVTLGYKVIVVEELSRGVDPDTSSQALDEMRNQGVTLFTNFDSVRIKT
jgi:nicotinamidase/pyrazinamidase